MSKKMDEELPDTLTPVVVESPINSQNVPQIPWGRLLSCKLYTPSVDLIELRFSFGRSEDCTQTVTKQSCRLNNFMNISKVHFSIEKSLDDNLVYIIDESKNGTFVNGEKLGRGKRKILKNDDQISVSLPKNSVYIFTLVGAEGKDNFLPPELVVKYANIKRLGKGSSGEVRLVKDRDTCECFAVKRILLGSSNSSQMHKINHPSKIRNEIEILKTIRHPNIIGLQDINLVDNEVFLVLEYMRGGELSSRIIAVDKEFSENSARFYFYQMLLAVRYLHSNKVIHRDLKPDNILLLDDRDETLLKITDFGLSKITDNSDMETMCGTLRFVAPEVLERSLRDYGEYGKEVDIWSLGVILYVMLSKEFPFWGEDAELRKNIVECNYNMRPDVWGKISTEAKDLIKRMLVLAPKARIKVCDIFEHPWLKKDIGVRTRVERLIEQEGYEIPMDYLITEPPGKKIKLSHSFDSSTSSNSGNSTLSGYSSYGNLTFVC